MLSQEGMTRYDSGNNELFGRSAFAMRPSRPTEPPQVTEYGLLRLIERSRRDVDYLCSLTNEISHDEELRSQFLTLPSYPRPYEFETPGLLDYMLLVLEESAADREALLRAVNQSETLRTKILRLIDMLGPVPLGSAGVGMKRPLGGGLRRQGSSHSSGSEERQEGGIRSHPIHLEDIGLSTEDRASSGSTYNESPKSGQGSGKSSPRSPR
ncbi:hypothetical protein MMC10_011447 [Thelotrema lepadinum]|nr:hypothetical protein [Thelotrema lepadinum]